MKGQLTIRPGCLEDAAALADIGARTFWQTYKDNPNASNEDLRAYIERAYDPGTIRSELGNKEFLYLIAQVKAEIAGFARLKIGSRIECVDGERPLEISRIYLRREFQGAGYGKELLEACFDKAAGHGCDTVWLGVWKHNENAIGFYQKAGLRTVGTFAFDLAGTRHDDLVMALRLEEEETAENG